MSLCAPVYVPVGSTALRPVAVCLQELVTGKAPKDLFLSSSQMQSLRAQHPGVTRPRGTRQAELWERGGEGPPLLPLTPEWDEVCDLYPLVGGCRGRASRRSS